MSLRSQLLSAVAHAPFYLAFVGLPFLGGLNSGAVSDHQIDHSVRFNAGDAPSLTYTPSTNGNRRLWSFSFWFKRSALSTGSNHKTILAAGQSSPWDMLFFGGTTTVDALHYATTAGISQHPYTNEVCRDFGAWSHGLLVFDTAQATVADRIKLYVNRELRTWTVTTGFPAQNTDYLVNSTVPHYIGAFYSGGLTGHLDGYLAEMYMIQGQALTPSDFTEIDATTNEIKAKAYTGSFGPDDWYLDFSDKTGATSSALGKDRSGNNHDWTPTNISVTAGIGNDVLTDSPTNYGVDTGVGGEVRGNYAVLNPLNKGTNSTLSNGNLQFLGATGVAVSRATFGMLAGESIIWYWETTISSANSGHVGIIREDAAATGYLGGNANAYAYNQAGNKGTNDVFVAYGSSFTSGDVISVAYHAGVGALWFSKNGTWQASATAAEIAAGTTTNAAYTGLTSGIFFPAIGNDTGAGDINFGQRVWVNGNVPSGAKALCTQNLPTPTIIRPANYFDINTRAGTAATFNVTGKLFQPDLVWIKQRSGATTRDHAVYDAVRGIEKRLETNNGDAEVTGDSTGLTAFNNDGFTGGALAQINDAGDEVYVDYMWDKNIVAGLDIVNIASTSAAAVNHSLGVKPNLLIAKRTDSANAWLVTHKNLSGSMQDQYILLNLDDGTVTSAGIWGGEPTSTQFYVGTSILTAGSSCICYLFAEVAGFSRINFYIGNGSADGTFVWCGFRPKYILHKRATASTDNSWTISDAVRSSFNPSSVAFLAETSDNDSALDVIDFLSNGFKLRSTGSGGNTSGAVYIFIAFAEYPFKYARAR